MSKDTENVLFVFTSIIIHGTGTALSDDNGRTLVNVLEREGRERITIVSGGWEGEKTVASSTPLVTLTLEKK